MQEVQVLYILKEKQKTSYMRIRIKRELEAGTLPTLNRRSFLIFLALLDLKAAPVAAPPLHRIHP